MCAISAFDDDDCLDAENYFVGKIWKLLIIDIDFVNIFSDESGKKRRGGHEPEYVKARLTSLASALCLVSGQIFILVIF